MAPTFLNKLYQMTHDPAGFVVWDDDGTQFHVTDVQAFARDVLPRFWKTNNYASFVRQLNLYGFRRTTDNKGKGVLGKISVEWFHHPHFLRGQHGLLNQIERKPSSKRGRAPTIAPIVKNCEGKRVPEMSKQMACCNCAQTVESLRQENLKAMTCIKTLSLANQELRRQLREAQAMAALALQKTDYHVSHGNHILPDHVPNSPSSTFSSDFEMGVSRDDHSDDLGRLQRELDSYAHYPSLKAELEVHAVQGPCPPPNAC